MVNKNLKEDKIVEALKQNSLMAKGKKHEKRKTFIGFLEKSTNPGYWRVYTSLALDDYIEIAEEDIISSYSLESPSNPIGGTIVWVRADAEIQNVRTTSAEERGFLQGDITTQFAGQEYLGPGPGETEYTPLTTTITMSLRSACCTNRPTLCARCSVRIPGGPHCF